MGKRIVTLILIMILCGCSGCASLMGNKDKTTCISPEEFLSYLQEPEELSPENWEEYFEIVSGETKEIETTYYRTIEQYYFLKLKKNCYLADDEVQIQLSGIRSYDGIYTYVYRDEIYERSDEPFDYEYSFTFSETPIQGQMFVKHRDSDQKVYASDDGRSMSEIPSEEWDNYCCTMEFFNEVATAECMGASGRVGKVTIPEELWNYEEEDVRYLCIGTEDSYFRIYELTFQDDYRRYLDWLEE